MIDKGQGFDGLAKVLTYFCVTIFDVISNFLAS